MRSHRSGRMHFKPLSLALIVAGLVTGIYHNAIEVTPLAFRTIGFADLLSLAIVAMLAGYAVLGVLRWPELLRRDGALYLFFAYNAVSILWTAEWNRTEALHWLGYLGIAIAIYVAVQVYAADRSRAYALVVALLVLLLLYSAANLVSWQWNYAVVPDAAFDGRGARFQGITVSPSRLAGTLSFLIAVPLAVLVLRRTSGRLRIVAGVALSFGLLVVGLTFTRSALIGIGLGLEVALWLAGYRRVVAALAVVAIVLMISPVGNRFLTGWTGILQGVDIRDIPGFTTAVGRFDLWQQALTSGFHPWTPLFGDGIGTANVLLPGSGTHSEALQVFIDTGLIGLGLLVWAVVVVAQRALKLFHSGSGLAMTLALAALCDLAITAPRWGWDWVLNNEVGWLLMAVLGLASAASAWPKERAPAGG
jgi:hypothetical protein